MNFKTFRPLLLGASILMLGAAGAANAQAPTPQGDMAGAHDMGPGGMRRMGHERMDPAQMAQHRADRLRAALQLTPAQEPALKAFIDSTMPPPGMHERMRGEHEKMAAMTTPERLDRMRAMFDEHRAQFERHAAAVKRFYAQLTPAQQKAFDTLHTNPMGRGRMGHGMGQGMGHEMDPPGRG